MKTVADELGEATNQMIGMLKTLLLEHSSLYQSQNDVGGVVFINVHGDHYYRTLPEAGRQVQSKLLEDYRRYSTLLKVLLKEQPQDALREFSEADRVVLDTIEQQSTWCRNTQQALDKAADALMSELGLVKNLYDSSSGEVLLVPDTNALLYAHRLVEWEFDEILSFALVLTPAVLSELDWLKIQHRTETVRTKAESLIAQIKELRRRGKLIEGVTLVAGKSSVFSIATEPKIGDSLPWLDATNADDRFMASVIEVMRLHPRCVVLVVTRDVNLQNKLEFAGLPFVEPPEPVVAP